MGQVGEWGMTNSNNQPDTVSHNGCQLVGFVTNAPIMCDRNPASLTDFCQPLLVGRIMCKVVCMALDDEASIPQYGGELLAEVSVREEYKTQATRSYRIASSISFGVRS